jgi:hypothetical protein
MDVPLIPATLQTRTRKPIPWLPLLVGAIVCFALLLVIVPVWAQKKERATFKPAADARSRAEDLLNTLGAPPGCTPADFWVAERGPWRRTVWNAGEARLSWIHPHQFAPSIPSIESTPKDFPSVAAWYSAKLLPKGWRAHRAADATGAEFCQAPWLLRLTPTGSGYELKLGWDIHFTADRCAHP